MHPTRPLIVTGLLIALASTAWQPAHAHFPWLASDSQGHAILWFGESTDDRTYTMPERIRSIHLMASESGTPLATQAIDRDDLVGIRSKTPVAKDTELFGTAIYGLYHGMKLTYHVEHLPQRDPQQWPVEPRKDAALQTVITPAAKGGVHVTVLRDGKPVSDLEVKLFCEEGHEQGSRKTDKEGRVVFTGKEVEPGLNGVMVGVKDDKAQGSFEGDEYSSAADYLTATFYAADSQQPPTNKKSDPKTNVDKASGVSVVPSELPDLPEELTSFGAANCGQKLYVYGGHTGNAHSYSTAEQSNRFWCLDVSEGKNGTWEKLPGGPKLQGLALVQWSGRLIRIGGFTAMNDPGEDHDLHSQTTVASYDPAMGQWTDLAPLPEARSSLDAAVLGDKVYVVGGWELSGDSGKSHWHTTAWSLDLTDGDANWQPLAKPPLPRRANSVAAYNGKLYVIGGMRATDGPTTRVDIYDPATDSWSTGPALPGDGMSGFGSSAFATGGKLLVSTMDGFVYQLGEQQDAWIRAAKVDPARFFHRMVPLDANRLVMIGGANMSIGKFTEIDEIRTGGEE